MARQDFSSQTLFAICLLLDFIPCNLASAQLATLPCWSRSFKDPVVSTATGLF